jgi:hypothetical protein
MRRLDWILATVIGLFLVAAAAVETETLIGAAVHAARPAGRRLVETVAADIVRLPAARLFAARYHAMLPRE